MHNRNHSIDADPDDPPARRPAPHDTTGALCVVRLLGRVQASVGTQEVTRFPSRAGMALLARLALAPGRDHPREELIELLWPGVAPDTGRARLRQTLSTLKALLQPRSAQAPALIVADRHAVRAVPGMIDCDVLQFERALRRGDVEAARALYRGELMPGVYDEWLHTERQRLAALFDALPAPAVPLAAPAPAQLEAPVSGLPSYWTRAYGNAAARRQLEALIAGERLVTLLGPGGSGKTRLSVEAAQALQAGDAGAVFGRVVFVALADCSDAKQVLEAIALALQLPAGAGSRQRLVGALAPQRSLLVLDNVEQIDAGAAGELAALLAEVPALHLLLSSRRRLDLDGEQAFEVQGLALPPADAGPAEAAANPAVALFVDRARASRPAFAVNARNAQDLVALMRLLAGMPLAIELAASRLRATSPRELLQHLRGDAGSPMLDLLARGPAHAAPASRHASMRHAVAWSWRQLAPAQAALLQSMSVLVAPAQLAAVAAVAGASTRALPGLLDSLCGASLVQAEEGADGAMRYRLLQPVREFGAEQLGADGAVQARGRVRRWLTTFVGNGEPVELSTIEPQVPHLLAAITSSAADGAAREALVLAAASALYWQTDELPLTAALALEHALAEVDDRGLHAQVRVLLSQSHLRHGAVEQARSHAQAALDLAPDDRRRSRALTAVGVARYYTDVEDRTVAGLFDEAAALARRCGDGPALAQALQCQMVLATNQQGDFERAAALLDEVVLLWQRAGQPRMVRARLMERAVNWGASGRSSEALELLTECERSACRDRHWVIMGGAPYQLGRVLITLRRWNDATAALRRALRVSWQRQSTFYLGLTLLVLPAAMAATGRAEAAARLQGFALAHWARQYGPLNRIVAREVKATRRLLALQLGAARVRALQALGQAMSPADAVALALEDPAP